MYGFTIIDTEVDQRYSNAPDALDALFAHLRGELVGAAESRTIDWVLHDPAGPFLLGTCGSGGPLDTFVEANLTALHHGIASDLAFELYEASRQACCQPADGDHRIEGHGNTPARMSRAQ